MTNAKQQTTEQWLKSAALQINALILMAHAQGRDEFDKPEDRITNDDVDAAEAVLLAHLSAPIEDTSRLDWLQDAWRDGVHAEVCAKGDGTTWHAMAPSASVFVGPKTFTGNTLREAIDAARA